MAQLTIDEIAAIRPGDFVQFAKNFWDIYFEVESVSAWDNFWMITYITYDKYGSRPYKRWENGGGWGIVRVVAAEMAVPVIMKRGHRFQASWGQYDPFYGFAPAGTRMREKGQ